MDRIGWHKERGDTIEDREMLALASRRYYRWREVDEGEQPNSSAY